MANSAFDLTKTTVREIKIVNISKIKRTRQSLEVTIYKR
jgi:hypothetical protein